MKKVKPERFFEGVPERTFEEVQRPKPKKPTMWKWIKKNALKRLLPFLKEIGSIKLSMNISNGIATASAKVIVLGETVLEGEIARKL